MRRHDIIFLSTVLLLCSWHLDSSHNANTISRAAMVASLAEHGTLRIDRYHHRTEDKAHVGDHYYSEKAPLPSLLMVPFWWVAVETGPCDPSADGAIGDDLLRLCGLLCGSVPLTLIIFWIWRRMRTIDMPIAPSWLAILPMLGSYLFVYSGSFYGHLIAAFFLLIAWDRMKEDLNISAGILSSAAVLSEYSLFVFPLIWCIQLAVSGRLKDLFRFIIGGLPGMILLLALNTMITGSPFQLPYTQVHAHADEQRILGLAAPAIDALIGLFFTPYRGMFIYAPVTVLCMVAILRRIGKMDLKSILLHPLILPSIGLVLLIASHSMWWGGWALGTRHLTAITVLVLAAGIPLIRWNPLFAWLFLVFSFTGLLVNFAAKSTIWFSAPTDVKDPIFGLIMPAFADGSFTTMQWPVDAGCDPVTATFLFFILFIVSLIVLRWNDHRISIARK